MKDFNFFLFTSIFIFNIFVFQIKCFSRISHQHRDSVLLISLDGLHAGIFDKYLKDNVNSSFNEIINTGVKAEYMIPVFPTGLMLEVWFLNRYNLFYLFCK